MAFVEATCNVGDSINTIDEMAITPSKKRKIAINPINNFCSSKVFASKFCDFLYFSILKIL